MSPYKFIELELSAKVDQLLTESRFSVDSVESMTGYDFFSNVPASIQSVIASRIDTQ